MHEDEDNAEWLDFITSIVDLLLFGLPIVDYPTADSFKIRTIIIKIIQSPHIRSVIKAKSKLVKQNNSIDLFVMRGAPFIQNVWIVL